MMAWTERLHAYYERFFRDRTHPAYFVFARPNPITAGSGIGLLHSFLVTYGPQSQADELKVVTAHEMLHTWVDSLDEPQGLASSWFGEGLAVYYERALPLRSGAFTPAEFLKDLNQTAARYYTDALIHTPNAQIPAGFWRDTRIRVLPYDRGSLYFAALDSKILEASHGKRSLDDLVLAMLERRRLGEPMDLGAWIALLRAELGPEGPADLKAMLAGATVLPPSRAFGPCFERTTVLLMRYQLGFDPASLVSRPRIVRGLIAGSAAAQAGVRNGDEIVRPVPQDGVQADQHATLTLELRRGARTVTVTYLPRGRTVEAYQWRRVPGVADRECARGG
jgi:predicted metalloprotease with PDZ domain